MNRTTGWTAFKIGTGKTDSRGVIVRYILVPPMPEAVQRLEVNKVLSSVETIEDSYPADNITWGPTYIDILTF